MFFSVLSVTKFTASHLHCICATHNEITVLLLFYLFKMLVTTIVLHIEFAGFFYYVLSHLPVFSGFFKRLMVI